MLALNASRARGDEAERLLLQLEQTFYATGFLDPKEPKRLSNSRRRRWPRLLMIPNSISS